MTLTGGAVACSVFGSASAGLSSLGIGVRGEDGLKRLSDVVARGGDMTPSDDGVGGCDMMV